MAHRAHKHPRKKLKKGFFLVDRVGQSGGVWLIVSELTTHAATADESPLFVHHFVHTLDPKKRLTVPSEFRDQLPHSRGIYMIPGVPERCIYLYPPREFDKHLKKIREDVTRDRRRMRRFLARLGAWSDFTNWDSQGRIRIKDNLLEYAGITEQVVLVGAFELIEVWSPDVWESTNPLDDKQLQEASEHAGFY